MASRTQGTALAAMGIAMLLSACVPAQRLPSDDVLEKAALAAQSLDSANLVAHTKIHVELEQTVYEAVLETLGTLQSGGAQVQLRTQLRGTMAKRDATTRITGDVEVLSAGPHEVYARLHEMETDPQLQQFDPTVVQHLLGKWWKLPAQATAEEGGTVTPKPELLRMQSQVVRVTQEHGFATIDGKRAYHYDVAVDPAKLYTYLQQMQAETGQPFDAAKAKSFTEQFIADGELWIDAQTFYVRRLRWSIQPVDGTAYAVTLDVTLRDHNAASPITPPADAQELQLDTILPPADSAAVRSPTTLP